MGYSKRMSTIVLIAHNLRSSHNVGSLLRTADGLGIKMAYLTGYTPYPLAPNDARLPHIAAKVDKQIAKTALGAEKSQRWQHLDSITPVISDLRAQGYQIAALEQTVGSVPLPTFTPPDKIAVIVGREVEGLESEVLALCDLALEIPMFGQKESFNVVQAAAMVLYQLSQLS